jgi:hypothetical protein
MMLVPRRGLAACVLLLIAALAAAAPAPLRLFLFTAVPPPGIDEAGAARRTATLADLRTILSKDPRVVLAETPDEAEITVEVTASRLTRTADDSLIETVDLTIVMSDQHGEVRGVPHRTLGRWKDAALDASQQLFSWVEAHRTADGAPKAVAR